MRINIYSIKQVRESCVTYKGIEEAKISNPMDVADLVNHLFDLASADRESFGILCLNAKNKINGAHIVSVGSLNGSIAHPREVFKLAILNNAAGIILFHNHPSGDTTPSPEDKAVTHKMIEAGRLLDIKVLDHIIIGHDGRFTSLANEGYMK